MESRSTVWAAAFLVIAAIASYLILTRTMSPAKPVVRQPLSAADKLVATWDAKLQSMTGRRIESSDSFVNLIKQELVQTITLPEESHWTKDMIAHLAAEIIRTLGHPKESRINEILDANSIDKYENPKEFFEGIHKMIASARWVYLTNSYFTLTSEANSSSESLVVLAFNIIDRSAEENTIRFKATRSANGHIKLSPSLSFGTMTTWPMDTTPISFPQNTQVDTGN
jgi:hypothetical protein